MKCWIVIVQDGNGALRELDVEAASGDECRRIVAEELPGVRLVRVMRAVWDR